MPDIRVLPKEISELIAAGEVVDRPVSVVKELVENAIDAGATEITVEIKKGGIEYIRITDNGKGISPEEVPTAFLRHATSKIRKEEDLESIATLGFRGEALASVCAVAKVEMLTKPADSPFGTRICLEGGVQTLLEDAGCPDGTTIIVRDLFYNVPARLKFLKKDVSEGNAIASMINRMALSEPAVSFTLIRENTRQLQTPGDGSLYSAIYAVYGKEFAGSLMEVDYSLGDIKVTGYSSIPAQSRANRLMQHFFVNGRYVRSRTCAVALEEGYKNAIMVGKFPACVLNVTLPYDFVDVNVHPTKTEVRFVNERSVYDCLYFAIKTAITANEVKKTEVLPVRENYRSPFVPDVGEQVSLPRPVSEGAFVKSESVVFSKPSAEDSVFVPKARPSFPAEQVVASGSVEYKIHLEIPDPEPDPEPEIKREEYQFLKPESFLQKAEPVLDAPVSAPPVLEEPVFSKDSEPEKEEVSIRLIGEVFQTYILAEIDDFFVMVDKHAAHERILYEKLKSEQKPLDHQILLSPFTVVLSVEECEAIFSNRDVLDRLGFLVEEFGNSLVLIREIPAILDRHDASQLLSEIALNLRSNRQDPSPDELDELYHSVACKAAIKAHDKNTQPELLELVRRVYTDEAIRYCPHGRPVLQIWSKSKVNKMFGR